MKNQTTRKLLTSVFAESSKYSRLRIQEGEAEAAAAAAVVAEIKQARNGCLLARIVELVNDI